MNIFRKLLITIGLIDSKTNSPMWECFISEDGFGTISLIECEKSTHVTFPPVMVEYGKAHVDYFKLMVSVVCIQSKLKKSQILEFSQGGKAVVRYCHNGVVQK